MKTNAYLLQLESEVEQSEHFYSARRVDGFFGSRATYQLVVLLLSVNGRNRRHVDQTPERRQDISTKFVKKKTISNRSLLFSNYNFWAVISSRSWWLRKKIFCFVPKTLHINFGYGAIMRKTSGTRWPSRKCSLLPNFSKYSGKKKNTHCVFQKVSKLKSLYVSIPATKPKWKIFWAS